MYVIEYTLIFDLRINFVQLGIIERSEDCQLGVIDVVLSSKFIVHFVVMLN